MSFLSELIAADVAAASGRGANNKFVVTLTPTAEDLSGTMDKTVGEICEALQAGKDIWFAVTYMGPTIYIRYSTVFSTSTNPYPGIMAYYLNPDMNVIVVMYFSTTNNGDDTNYGTKIYTLD